MAMIDTSVLSPKQVDLLRTFVEAERRVPKDYHEGFRGPTYQGISRITLYHRGLPDQELEVSGTDVFALAEEGLLTILRTPDLSAIRIHVNPDAEAYLEEVEERRRAIILKSGNLLQQGGGVASCLTVLSSTE